MRRKIKQLINKLGWDLQRQNSLSSPRSEILTVLDFIKADMVFDVGANIGQFATDLFSSGYSGRIISFEPLTKAHKTLRLAARNNPNWTVHSRTAIGDQDGEIEINISGNSVSSSALNMLDAHSSAAKDSAYIAKESSSIIRLDKISKQYLGDESRLFIKIDTQGYEWQVLDGGFETLKVAVGIMLELSLVQLYEGQKLWKEIIERIESKGFTLWTIQRGFTDTRTARSLQVDAIFIRNPDI